MANYQKMYLMLFNAITDAISALQRAQQSVEEIYISSADQVNITAFKKTDADSNGEK